MELHETKDIEKERVLLVTVDMMGERINDWETSETQHELEELVKACGGDIIDSIAMKLVKPSAKTLISSGKVEEIRALCAVHKIDSAIFSCEFKGNQQRNLEDILEVRTVDRTQLILDIFARHAISKEAQLQVELAQLAYMLPRLAGKGIELSRLGGGIGTLGPGETKLEVDRRRIDQKITRLKRDLKDVSADRSLKRKKRQENGVPVLSLVGYTNAGKSTLLNQLTDAGTKTHDGYFTTLDSLSRQLILPNNQKVVLSDTVGFMNDLPHHLIEAFKATLEEVQEADVLLRVLDVTHPNFRHLHDSVTAVLKELDVLEKPQLIIFNKIDLLEKNDWVTDLCQNFTHAIGISAKTGENIDQLQDKMVEMLSDLFCEIDLYIPINRMDMVNLAHQEGEVFSVKYYDESIHIRANLPKKFGGKFEKIAISKEK
jgi:GTP-binding protein HflX